MSVQQWVCPKCHAPNPATVAVCGRCRFAPVWQAAPTIQATTTPPKPSPWGWVVTCVLVAGLSFGLGWWASREHYARELRDTFSKVFNFNGLLPTALPAVPSKPAGKVVIDQVTAAPTIRMDSGFSFGNGPTHQRPVPEGNIWLICRVTVTNTGQERLILGADDFELVGSNRNAYGAIYNPSWTVPELQFINATLLPGGSASGHVLFSVPQGVTPERIDLTN